MSKAMIQIQTMLGHSMASGFWMEGEEIEYDDLIAYLNKLAEERARWVAAVEGLEEEVYSRTGLSPDDKYGYKLALEELLTRMEAS